MGYLIGPALQKQAQDWIQLGSVKKVETGTPTLFKVTLQHQTGWVTSQEEVAAYVLTEDGTVISGPPPRPMDRYKTKLDNGISPASLAPTSGCCRSRWPVSLASTSTSSSGMAFRPPPQKDE